MHPCNKLSSYLLYMFQLHNQQLHLDSFQLFSCSVSFLVTYYEIFPSSQTWLSTIFLKTIICKFQPVRKHLSTNRLWRLSAYLFLKMIYHQIITKFSKLSSKLTFPKLITKLLPNCPTYSVNDIVSGTFCYTKAFETEITWHAIQI